MFFARTTWENDLGIRPTKNQESALCVYGRSFMTHTKPVSRTAEMSSEPKSAGFFNVTEL